jgi:hypothetical protein
MAKIVIKKKAVVKGGFKNIAALVRVRLKQNKDYPYEKLVKEVKALRPKSRFNEAHYAWYRSAIKNDRLKG